MKPEDLQPHCASSKKNSLTHNFPFYISLLCEWEKVLIFSFNCKTETIVSPKTLNSSSACGLHTVIVSMVFICIVLYFSMYSHGWNYWLPWNLCRKCAISLNKMSQLQMFWHTHVCSKKFNITSHRIPDMGWTRLLETGAGCSNHT